jgi:hypothetical protein
MTQQFLTCPIERKDDNHYTKIRDMWPTWEWSWVGDYRLTEDFKIKKDEQPSTYYRLFKRRTEEKTKKYRRYPPLYAVMSVDRQPILMANTKKEALQALKHNRLRRKIFRKPYKDYQTKECFGDVPVGSFVLRIPRLHGYMDLSQRDHLNDTKHIVATKKCAECPNKTSTRGACHCGFWSVLKDSTNGGQWWSMHDIKRYQKREEKRKVYNIVLTKKDLLD